jgi:hypothetical protein
MLGNIKEEKSTLAWSKNPTPDNFNNTRYYKSREERIYDPVQAKFRDDRQERHFQKQEKAFVDMNLSTAKLNEITKGAQTYNIVNNKGKVRQRPQKNEEHIDHNYTRANWNILSNKNVRGVPGPDQTLARRGKADPESTNANVRPRNVNIVSNKYKVNHDRKAEMDATAAKQFAAAKYWGHGQNAGHTQKRDYNPVEGTFYSPMKETEYQTAQEFNQTVAGAAQARNLPPSTQLSEGMIYDIVNNGSKVDDVGSMSEQQQKYSQNRPPPILERAVSTGTLPNRQDVLGTGLGVRHSQSQNAERDWQQRSLAQEERNASRVQNKFSSTQNRTWLATGAPRHDLITNAKKPLRRAAPNRGFADWTPRGETAREGGASYRSSWSTARGGDSFRESARPMTTGGLAFSPMKSIRR